MTPVTESKRLLIITGGSHGLGAAFCAQYRQMGFQIVSFSRTGRGDDNIAVDLVDPQKAQKVFDSSFSRLAERDYEAIIAISNVGTLSPIGPAAQKAVEDITANMNVNFTSPILFMRAFIGYFQNHHCKKTLVNVSSGAALKGYFGWSLYCGAKAGMENFIRAVALEQAVEQFPITAFSIDPSIMDTGMQAGIRKSTLHDFPDRPRFDGFKEDGALKDPSNVAAAIIGMIDDNPHGGERKKVR
jgi:benzil reductase ((S)-benzoin forming)